MFNSLITALVYEMLHFVSGHKDRKLELMGNLRIPSVFKKYLSEVKEKDFLIDLKVALDFIERSKSASASMPLNLSKSDFFKSFTDFLSTTFASKLDQLPSEFYILPNNEKEKLVSKVIDSDSLVAKALKNLIVINSYQEISSSIEDLCRFVYGSAYVVVQSPRDIDSELKIQIRKHLADEKKHSFPLFQINKKLIGGIRVFVDGKSVDNSWFSKISQLSTLGRL